MHKKLRRKKQIYIKIKRAGDILIALTALIIFAPVMLLIAILIKLESKGPVFFKQPRYGIGAKEFQMYKFRSMKQNAEKEGVYVKKHDKRVTGVGRVIRKISMDELPQLINILKNEMAIIGPRPVLTYHPWTLDKYTDEQRKRFGVRPGLTGLAQVNGRKGIDWNKRIEYDIKYIENINVKLDLKIFLKTIVQVIRMKDNVNTGKTASSKRHETRDAGHEKSQTSLLTDNGKRITTER